MPKNCSRFYSFGGIAMLAALAGLGAPARGPQTPTPRPYPLATCPVSGEELGSMGDAVVKVVEGREVRFCCERCVGKFEADAASYWKKVDEEIIATQLMHYPVVGCPVSGHELREDPEHGAVSLVHDNRLVRLCCADCQEDFAADPQKMLSDLDKEIADAQREHYPLKECVVGGGELGSMGEPFEIVFENRLVRFCCESCLEDFNGDPHAYMAKIDEGYAAAQRESYPLKECVVSGRELGAAGEAVELVAGDRLVKFCCEKCVPNFKKEPAKYLAKLDGGDE